MDPKSLEETQREVTQSKGASSQPQAGASGLDATGLPPGMRFDPAWEVTPRQTKQAIDRNGDKTVILDVREPHEWDITHIVGKEKLFPRDQWPQIPTKLAGNESAEIIIHCRSGARSLQVAKLLRQNGFTNAKSMAGGILLWNKDVNPGGPQY
jgi:adenylyltransferase/sulfurtransferase